MITADATILEPGNEVKLFELDLTPLGGDLLRFHGYKQIADIIWKGETYKPWAIEADGFDKDGRGTLPSPTLRVGNIGQTAEGVAIPGMITSLCRQFDDLVGARFTRIRTLGTYLDAVNFAGGNPSADPTQEFPREVWLIECKTAANATTVEFELRSALDFSGQRLPGRQILANSCGWLTRGGYRGPYCGYTGPAMFDLDDNPVADPTLDKCSGRLSSCKLRHGEFNELPYGGQPAADLLRGY